MKYLLKLAVLFFSVPLTMVAQKPTDPPTVPIPESVTYAPENPALPSIFLVGDSTAAGYGTQFAMLFDPAKVNVVKAGAGGRSSRTYITEGLWARVMKQMKPHDIVLLQFGHNDASAVVDTNRCRGSLKGVGDETQEIDNPMTHEHEVVRTFGAYMRQMIDEAKARGAVVILMSLTPHNDWKDGHMTPDRGGYSGWTAEIASKEHVAYVDVNALLGAYFQGLGEVETTKIFLPNDKVHQTQAGWALYAGMIAGGLKALPDAPVSRFLSTKGKAVPVAAAK